MNLNKSIKYSIYGKTTTSEPCEVQCKPGETVHGTVTYPGSMDVFSGSLYRTDSPTGANPYVQTGSNWFTGAAAGLTGVNKECSFTVDTSLINAPTGVIDSEIYALKLTAGHTGIFAVKCVADIVINIKAEVE